MAIDTTIQINNPHEWETPALIAAVTRAQRMVTGDLPPHWESTRVTMHTKGRDRDGMLECMLVHTATHIVPDSCAHNAVRKHEGVVIAVGMIQRPGSDEFEFHS